jgi:nicotinamide phosphoribosyltransferase
VVRPDSGDPTIVPIEVIELLMERVGYTINRLGYKVLPSYFRVIQGDGINVESIRTILQTMKAAGLSASNIAFGQGGGLLQQVNRDTQKFAMKCSAIEVNGVWRDVWKDPISDSGKQSKRGRLALIESTGIGGGVWRTILETEVSSHIPTTLRTVFDTGIISNITSFESVRALASKEFSVREDT